jgi:hypothetical protein
VVGVSGQLVLHIQKPIFKFRVLSVGQDGWIIDPGGSPGAVKYLSAQLYLHCLLSEGIPELVTFNSKYCDSFFFRLDTLLQL